MKDFYLVTPPLQRDTPVVQLDHFTLVKDRIIIWVTPGDHGMPLKICRGGHFFTASVIRCFWTSRSAPRASTQSHIWSSLCLYQRLSLAAKSRPAQHRPTPTHHRSDESRIPLLLNSSKHHFQTLVAGRERECGGRGEGRKRRGEEEGGLDLQPRAMQKGHNVFFDGTPTQTGQKAFLLERHDSAHTASQNTALCKSSKNAFTFHSCSYFRQA